MSRCGGRGGESGREDKLLIVMIPIWMVGWSAGGTSRGLIRSEGQSMLAYFDLFRSRRGR